MYDYIHNVCHYSKSYKRDCLYIHIDKLKQIKEKTLCILSIMRDANETIEEKEHFESLSTDNLTIKVNYYFNCGGTVMSMWNTWKYLEENSIEGKYFATFEDDIVPRNPGWVAEMAELLNDHIYIGMQSYCGISNWDRRNRKRGYNTVIRKSRGPTERYHKHADMRWTCGGVYFMKFESLKEIETKIGRFHKANVNDRYNRTDHGILLGEVGFPTDLHLAGFTFKGIHCNPSDTESYFEWLDTPHPEYPDAKWVPRDYDAVILSNRAAFQLFRETNS